jgi:glutathione S-transferase
VNEFMAGDEYTIADMAIWPWYGTLMQGNVYNDAATYLDTGIWTDQIAERPAVKRGPGPRWSLPRAARSPRRQRFRVADPGQDRGAGLSDVRLPRQEADDRSSNELE